MIGRQQDANESGYLCFFIGSKDYYQHSPGLASYAIKKQNYPFFEKDISYVDVHRPAVLLEAHIQEVKELGELTDATQLEIKRIAQNSLTVSLFDKKVISKM